MTPSSHGLRLLPWTRVRSAAIYLARLSGTMVMPRAHPAAQRSVGSLARAWRPAVRRARLPPSKVTGITLGRFTIPIAEGPD